LSTAALGWNAACSLDDPGFIDGETRGEIRHLETDAGKRPDRAARDAAIDPTPGGDGGALPDPIPTGPDEPPLPLGCINGETRRCGPATEAGICALGKRTCVAGAWGECEGAVTPQARDCSSAEDNDCDGKPDNVVDAVCRCVPGDAQKCEEHVGLDGKGTCRSGQQSCLAAPDKKTSDWGRCGGSIGPAEADSCSIRNDDADCDGIPNGGCVCVEGEKRDCGPPHEVGICRFGESRCTNGALTACQGAVLSTGRDCSSPLDNDCNGTRDNLVDAACTCVVGAIEACDTHPGNDGKGACVAGQRVCELSANRLTSAFGACTGSVGPQPRSCASALDNDCNGRPDNTVDATCACQIGAVQACSVHLGQDGIGICRAGQQLCVAGAGNASSSYGACAGSVGPAAADSCVTLGDDSNCDGVPNGGCACVAGQGNAPCNANPAASRCSAQGTCAACTIDADCTLVSGRNVCDRGLCVECTATTGACAAGKVCDAVTRVCVAAPVVTTP
jgi:hypothetical protein